MAEVIHNEAAGRFEIRDGGATAFLEYRQRPGEIFLIHTEVPEELNGHGFGGLLAHTALEYARSHNLRAIPNCPFVAAYIKRHPEYMDLVSPAQPAKPSG